MAAEDDEIAALRAQLAREKEAVHFMEVKLVKKGTVRHFAEDKDAPPPDDLTEATEDLNDALIADYLKRRYKEDKIYTCVML